MRSKMPYVIYQDCYGLINFNKNLEEKKILFCFFQINRRRTYDDVFPDDDDDE